MQAKVKTRTAAQPLAVTANRLRDGRVVWLSDAGWSEHVVDAAVVSGEAAEAALTRAQADELRQIVVAPYLVEMEAPAGGRVLPLRMRERVRVFGPTILPQAAE